MATTITVTTGGTDLVELHRKVQGTMLQAFADECEERKWHTRLGKFKLAASQREVTTPINIRRGFGGSSIVEGGYESHPQTPQPEELTFAYIHRHNSYTTSRTTELLGKQGEKSQVFDQMKYQAMQNLSALNEHFAMATYGFSTAAVCLTSTNATQASGTYTLKDAYGKSDLDNAAYIAQFFKVGDRVALRRSGALVANAIGTVTAVTPATPSIAVTWAGSVDSDDNDEVIFAGSMENTTLAGGTDHNKWPVGFLDIIETASLHGLSSSTAPLWAAYSETSGGRFGFVKLRKMQNAVRNNGGGDVNHIVWAQGVEADVTDNLIGLSRYNSTMNMQLDGSTSVKGVSFIGGTRWTPNSRVFAFDSEDLKIWEPAGQIPDKNGMLPDSSNPLVISDKLENISGKKTGSDYIYGRVCTNRGNFAMASSLTEQ